MAYTEMGVEQHVRATTPAGRALAPYSSLAPYALGNLVLSGVAAAVVIVIAIFGSLYDAAPGDWGRIDWALWVLAFLTIAFPILVLLVDRIADVPAPALFRWLGIPVAGVFIGVTLTTLVRGDPLFDLIWVGVVAALLGSVALDIVRLVGVHVFKAFPLDMPLMFGVIALGLAPRMQANMMARMVEMTAALPPAERRRALETRIEAIAELSAISRDRVVSAMFYGLGRLDPALRQEMLTTQMGILANLDPPSRTAMMQSMDKAMAGIQPSYGQPWGMLRLPLPQFRSMAAIALPLSARDGGASMGKVAFVGYFWHFLNGIGLIAPYTLLFGTGNWALAIAWGVFIWLGMMAAMPFMMRMLHFPWWFPVVPFIAHVAMMVPIALLAPVWLDGAALRSSLLGPFVTGG